MAIEIWLYIPCMNVTNNVQFLSEWFFLSYLEYITNQFSKFHYLIRIRLFQQILRILVNRRKESSSKVPPYDVTEIMLISCVAGLVFDQFMYNFFLINYVENVFQNQRWHVQWGAKRKLFTYLGAMDTNLKVPKYECKGFGTNQKEAENSKRGYCCRGPNFAAICQKYQIDGGNLALKINLIQKSNNNACIIHTT